MTWPLWVGLVLCVLAVVAVGLSAYGAKRWSASVLASSQALDTARADARVDPPRPTRYDVRERRHRHRADLRVRALAYRLDAQVRVT